jgi:hypothetical protein
VAKKPEMREMSVNEKWSWVGAGSAFGMAASFAIEKYGIYLSLPALARRIRFPNDKKFKSCRS